MRFGSSSSFVGVEASRVASPIFTTESTVEFQPSPARLQGKPPPLQAPLEAQRRDDTGTRR